MTEYEVAEWEWVYSLTAPNGKVLGRFKHDGEGIMKLDEIHSQLMQLGLNDLIPEYKLTRRKRAIRFWIGPEEDVND